MSDRPLPPMKPYPQPVLQADADGIDVPTGTKLFYYVLDCLENDIERAEIRSRLIKWGYSPDDVDRIVADVAERRRSHVIQENRAPKPPQADGTAATIMWIGAAVCLLGIAITVLSSMLAGATGGHLVAAGAIVGGFSMFIWGLVKARSND